MIRRCCAFVSYEGYFALDFRAQVFCSFLSRSLRAQSLERGDDNFVRGQMPLLRDNLMRRDAGLSLSVRRIRRDGTRGLPIIPTAKYTRRFSYDNKRGYVWRVLLVSRIFWYLFGFAAHVQRDSSRFGVRTRSCMYDGVQACPAATKQCGIYKRLGATV